MGYIIILTSQGEQNMNNRDLLRLRQSYPLELKLEFTKRAIW